jgi:CrcB protein
MIGDGLSKIMLVALGGAFGAVARYLVNISPLGTQFGKFPLATFAVNITGSFLVGLLVSVGSRADISDNVKIMLVTGFLGAFTTFSAFEFETFALMKERHFATALLYVILSIAFGFIGVMLGVWLGQNRD